MIWNSNKYSGLARVQTIAIVCTALGTIALAIIGIFGLNYIVDELSELRKQNIFIESSLKQTFRPIGVASTNPEYPDSITIVTVYENDRKDRFSINITYHVRNYGQGILSYIGHFSHISTQEIDFRKEFLAGIFDSLTVDKHYSYIRRTSLLPYGEKSKRQLKTAIEMQDLPFYEKYFLYTLFLYEDQYGNLYDTEHLEVLTFTEPILGDKGLMVEADPTKGPHMKETYHYYDSDDRLLLATMIRALDEPKDHPMAAFVEGN